MAKQVKRKSSGFTKPDGNRKRGRSEMRTVIRTAARKPKDISEEHDADDLNSSDSLDEHQVNENDNDNDDEEEEEEDDDDDENSGMAYSALLTLLKSDHKEKKEKSELFNIEEQHQP